MGLEGDRDHQKAPNVSIGIPWCLLFGKIFGAIFFLRNLQTTVTLDGLDVMRSARTASSARPATYEDILSAVLINRNGL